MRLPSKPVVFTVLMALSAVSAFALPPSWTDWIRGPFQVLALPQWGMLGLGRNLRDAVDPEVRTEIERLTREIETLNLQLAQQQAAIVEFHRVIDDLSGLRGQTIDPHVRLLTAPVVSFDASPQRRTILVVLAADVFPHVSVGQWVAAGEQTPGSRAGLARQWIVGRVEEVMPRSARIVLTTDPNFRTAVQPARLETTPGAPAELRVLAAECKLEGLGGGARIGRMHLSQADSDHLAAGANVVVARPRGLAYPMVLGRLLRSTPLRESPLHFDIEAAPWGDATRLTHVYIISAKL